MRHSIPTQVMLQNEWMSGDFVTEDEKFDMWMEKDWPKGEIDDEFVPQAGNPEFPPNSVSFFFAVICCSIG